jgi:hypothetical protein
MTRILTILLLLCSLGAARGQHATDPASAIVRIKSHGASATIIATSQGRSWLLGCCHMYFGRATELSQAALARPLQIDGPAQPNAPARPVHARLLAYDARADLSLMELDNGPFYYVPVAAAGHRPSRNVRSLGYDAMQWPLTNRPATVLNTEGHTTYTVEKPWHGRSGGGLIDVTAMVLIGVVQGYEDGPPPYQRGLYVSHETILRFLQPHTSRMCPGGT